MAQRVIRAPRLRGAAERVVGAGLRAASRATLVPRRGRMRLNGLSGDVRVRFDRWGVPHVRATTDQDAFLAHGFCHALDRFFQMDMLRRVLRGRLAETIGDVSLGERSVPPLGRTSTAADADRLMRAFDLVGAARRYFLRSGEEGRLLLDAYVRGVNEGIRLLRRRRPLEHRLLRLPLRTWSPIDSVLIAKGMALGLSFKWRTAPVFTSIAERLSDRPDLLGSILPPVPGIGDEAVVRLVEDGVGQALRFLPTATTVQGSNAFVVGGSRSRSGLPILASDPHLELSLPPIWHLASVRGSRYAAVGCSLPGLPGIVIGRTENLAWALTNGMIDDADLWAEALDGTGTRYRVDGRWRPLRIQTNEIRRRGKPPVMFRLRQTHRGPLLSDAFPEYPGPPLSLRMTLHEPADDLEAFLGLGRARSADEIADAIVGYGAPVQNLLYADTRGTAGYQLIGKVPRRPTPPVHPALIRDGQTSEQDWQGIVPPADLPATRLAPDDALVSANEPIVDGRYPHYLSHLFEPTYRGHRIRARLAGRDGLTARALAEVQMDATNGAAGWFHDRVVLPHAEEVRRTKPTLARAIDRLLAWGGREHPDDVGPALWHLTYNHLLRRTFSAALGHELLHAWLGLVNLMDAPLRRAFEDPESPWAPPAVRAALLQRALDDATRDLEARGLTIDAPWGAIHRLTLRHPLSSVPVIGAAFDLGPYPLRGGPFAPSSGQYPHQRPASVTSGASYRQVVDLADPEGTSRMVTFGGQSGAIGSRHYGDLQPLWLEGRGIPMRLATWPEEGEDLILEP